MIIFCVSGRVCASQELDSLKRQMEKKVNAYKTAASQASQELSTAQVSLQSSMND
jgi:hypothetical protein